MLCTSIWMTWKPPNSIPCFKPSTPWTRKPFPVFNFYKCNITKMCNINFDADRQITPGTEREEQCWRILFRGRGEVIFIFFVMYCNFYFIMLPFFLSQSCIFFHFWGGRVGLYHFKRRKKMCIVLLSKRSILSLFQSLLLSPHLPPAVT